MNLNKVQIIGRLTRDPELRSTPSGQNVANFSVATSFTWTDKNGQKQEKTEFHNVVAWGRQAEIIAQYFVKGQEIYVEGRLETRSWDDKDSGKKMYRTEIILEKFEFGAKPAGAPQTSRQPQAAAPAAGAATAGTAIEEDIPTINLDDEKGDVKVEEVPF